MTRLIVWRHGRTEWNATGRFQGQTDVHLDDVGRAQAAAAARLLAAEQPDLIVSSDLSRAAQTAQALAEVTGQPMELDARLRERDFGPWQGHTREEIEAQWPDEYTQWRAGKPNVTGLEPLDEVVKRASGAFWDAADRVADGRAGGGTAVLVTHGGTAKHGFAALLGWSLAISRTLGVLRNCHWTELRHGASTWRMIAYNVGIREPGGHG